MKFRHPLWLAGFRPFFALAMLSGALLPMAWMLVRATAVLPASTSGLAPMAWHAHEMFFGFGGAVLAGFLLTASKNWVGIRGYHGAWLALLALLWLLARYAAWCGPGLLALPFTAAFVVMVLATLIRHRGHDSYRIDNRYFILGLPWLLLAQVWLLDAGHFADGVAVSLAVFRLAFLLMLERTLAQFMRGVFGLELPARPRRDHLIKSLALGLVLTPWLPAPVAGALAAVAACLMLWRWCEWYPRRALSRIDIGIMALGHLAIAAQLGATALVACTVIPALAGVQTHLFTLGALGLIVPAMMVRISKGHTGRKVAFDRADNAVLWLMIGALALRVGVPVVLPSGYLAGLWGAAILWLAAFGWLAVRYLPFLVSPRADGREH